MSREENPLLRRSTVSGINLERGRGFNASFNHSDFRTRTFEKPVHLSNLLMRDLRGALIQNGDFRRSLGRHESLRFPRAW